jgi:2-oxoglutarate dehydrogenase E1 component
MTLPPSLHAEFGSNAGYIEELYALFKTDPALVGDAWAVFFRAHVGGDSFPHAGNGSNGNGYHAPTAERPAPGPRASNEVQACAAALIHAFRERGHLHAAVNPLKSGGALPRQADIAELLARVPMFDRTTVVDTLGFGGRREMALGELVTALGQIYTGSIGFECSHLVDGAARRWLTERIEARLSVPELSAGMRRHIFSKLVDAEGFEAELHKKYVGVKRFSLQGGDSLLPLLDAVLDEGAGRGSSEVVIGMSHRGRVNVLANIVGKPLADIFNEFEDSNLVTALGAGDVKYHLGYSSLYTGYADEGATARVIKVSLAPNPSHLEFVDPVVEGIVRAKQDKEHGGDRRSVIPVLIHGDAAFAGQGVVFETINYAGLPSYSTGGTIHIIVNNQVGFTTNPDESRSTPYCTDLARGVHIPVFHVNGEDPEAVVWVARLAVEYRYHFGGDVIIDVIGFRRYGHNEGDDPSFTQPTMYAEINAKPPTAKAYGQTLVNRGVLVDGDIKAAFDSFAHRFAAAHSEKKIVPTGEACAMHGMLRVPNPPTGVDAAVLRRIGATLVSFPSDFKPHPKVEKILEKRVESLEAGSGIDWGFAEGLAIGSLVLDGHTVRLTGQDCGRGTFSQRHLKLADVEGRGYYLPFDTFATPGGARFEVHNSSLSEAAVVGFEFGYASVARRDLVMWEAQFGDFANGAQVHIDQFVASSEAKWNQLSGVVLLLPHGFEGQGPEHSSARLERYLQLCAEGNMVVCYPTQAAQHFHLLRRQGLLEIQRPLIVMTPKSLLRHPGAAATIDELTTGQFETVLTDRIGGGTPRHAVFLSGKVFYDVKAMLEKEKVEGVALVRFEQLYPFPQFEIKRALKEGAFTSFTWVQEEPQNMGAWGYIEPYLRQKLGVDVAYVGRPAAASPATGSGKRHVVEQQRFLNELLSIVRKK